MTRLARLLGTVVGVLPQCSPRRQIADHGEDLAVSSPVRRHGYRREPVCERTTNVHLRGEWRRMLKVQSDKKRKNLNSVNHPAGHGFDARGQHT